jgi:hypothetical protein
VAAGGPLTIIKQKSKNFKQSKSYFRDDAFLIAAFSPDFIQGTPVILNRNYN